MSHVLIAADADWVIDEVRSALEAADTTFTICRSGQEVTGAATRQPPDLAVLDLQIGNMGGMAVTMDLRLDESGGRLPHIKVLMLLDRMADLFLARRAGAEGWLVKPLDPRRLRRAATTILSGGRVYEGLPAETLPADEVAAVAGLPADGTPPSGPDAAGSSDDAAAVPSGGSAAVPSGGSAAVPSDDAAAESARGDEVPTG